MLLSDDTDGSLFHSEVKMSIMWTSQGLTEFDQKCIILWQSLKETFTIISARFYYGDSSLVRRVICPKHIGLGLGLGLGLASNFGICTTLISDK